MLLIDRTGAIADRWLVIDGEEPLPAEGPVILPLDRIAEAEGRPETGIHLPNDTDPRALVARFPDLALVSVEFPSFADGRGFSIGRSLRELGYAGRLRATGPVIADQFAYLLECGFDEVAVPEDVARRQPVEHWMAQLTRIGLAYQRGRTGRSSIPEKRHAAHA